MGLKVFNIKPLQMDKTHDNASSSEKVHPLLSSHIKIHLHIGLEKFWTVFTCKRCLIYAYFSLDSDDFFTGVSKIMDCNWLVCILQLTGKLSFHSREGKLVF